VAASGAVVGANLVLLNGAHRRLVDLESKSRSCGIMALVVTGPKPGDRQRPL
jgi:hypothetical protein